MTDQFATASTFEIGRALSRAFGIFLDNAVVFGGLTILVWMLVGAIQMVVTVTTGISAVTGKPTAPDDPNTVAAVMLNGIFYLFSILFAFGFTQALAGYGAVCAAEGRRAGFGDSLARGLKGAFPVGILILISVIAIYIGAMIFIVPGVILGVLLGLVAPAYMDGAGFGGAFGRSISISEGQRFLLWCYLVVSNIILWLLLGALVVVGSLIFAVPLTAIGMTAETEPSLGLALPLVLGFGVIYAIVSAAVLLAIAVIPAGAYAEFRAVRGQRAERREAAALFD